MGILNVTPDSFSDGGRFNARDKALRQAELMIAEGADIIDVGGESTRPGSDAVSETRELERVVPVIEALRDITDVPVSIDTTKAGVMRESVQAGACLINDVMALQGVGALQAAAEAAVPVCLMHMLGTPRTMQEDPEYGDVTQDICAFLRDRITACVDAGISKDLIIVDPGFGFGKTAEHNVELLRNLRQLADLGRPILAGLSRKSTLGLLTGRDVDERVPASLAAAVVAIMNGAHIVRVHDVAETVDAMRVVRAVLESGNQ